ncbi:hypothetical protein D0Z07_5117 [Hyphodiscus hymeniophilus]|uniref:SH3 domain-containing protein n=1 Tax=Hyphodiscus hymeniophilus TaxID=353542 RepID=A0A9P6VIG4_9HELO|nr:hypothetical protein D0Z07_5117 [Hyphodiscus hymeniophilus]
MFVAANPNKGKTDDEKAEERRKYKPGDNVIPRLEAREKTLRERRVEDEDRRLLNEVRDLSLREVGVESSEARRERRRHEGRSHHSRTQSSGHRESSRDSRNTEDRERRRRRAASAERRREREDAIGAGLRADIRPTEDPRRRRNDEEASRRHGETNRTSARQIEHQSSLRSLISSSDIDSHEMEEEILRQIREEGLLDGIDLENIDVNQEDQISERIAEAFRRRQSERAKQDATRRTEASSRRRHTSSRSSAPPSRETSGDENAPTTTTTTTRRSRTHSRSPSGVSQSDEPSRPPPSMSAVHAQHLDVTSGGEGRRRRRTTSSSRSATTPLPVADVEARPAARSQTDLSSRPRSSQYAPARPTENVRSSTDPIVERAVELPAPDLLARDGQIVSSPTSNRNSASFRGEDAPIPASTLAPKSRAAPPADILLPNPTPLPDSNVTLLDRSLLPAPLSPRGASLSEKANAMSSGSRPNSSSSIASKTRPQLYPEPSLTCAKCAKTHVEYELHYNCSKCHGGNYNICLSCYRSAAGCLYWFGFGYAAFAKFDRMEKSGELPPNAEDPHMLRASRFIPPKSVPGGADGRKTLTTDDPQNRLQSGAFCQNCLAWANECYWRCEVCNEGDWGFCNNCVNQGKSCTHPLLPLMYKPSESYAPSLSPTHDQHTPPSASIIPGVAGFGNFRPLSFSTTCDICHYPIQPSSTRYHCFSCVSKVPNTQPGDYDICTTCYPKLVTSRRISAENGNNGWRRCLQGHRMVIVGFEDSRYGQLRRVVHGLVGGLGLRQENITIQDHAGGELQKWSWGDKKHPLDKLVTKDVMRTAPTHTDGMVIQSGFPPDGGLGMRCLANWSWYGSTDGADDELMFPKGAELGECVNVNTDWFHGAYMGKMGLFPGNFVRILDAGS